jgi:hypothetical protein
VKEEDKEDIPCVYIFPTPRADHGDWSHYQGAYTDYKNPLPWALVMPGAVYEQVATEDTPEDDDIDYQPMEQDADELMEKEAIVQADALSSAAEHAKLALL